MTKPLDQIHDATKLQAYMVCPRKYFFRYVLGWTPEVPSLHLSFGSAWHHAMEHLLLNGYDQTDAAFEKFLSSLTEENPIEAFLDFNPKTPENALKALKQYALRYASDKFEVLHTEVSGSVPISDTKELYFKIDSICHDHRGYFILEHKTASRFSSLWAAEWRRKTQVFLYTHVLHCLYPESEVFGTIINGVFFAPEAKLRKDGQPYANSRENEFFRLSVHVAMRNLAVWLRETESWVLEIKYDFKLARAKNPIAFRCNTESCTKYGVCPYANLCYLNPTTEDLYRLETPEGFKEEHWDPRKIPGTKMLPLTNGAAK